MATFQCRIQFLDDIDPFNATYIPEPSRPQVFTFVKNLSLRNQILSVKRLLNAPQKAEDCALQVFRIIGAQAEFGNYLDLDSSLEEQWDDVEILLTE